MSSSALTGATVKMPIKKKTESFITNKPTEANNEILQYFQQFENKNLAKLLSTKTSNFPSYSLKLFTSKKKAAAEKKSKNTYSSSLKNNNNNNNNKINSSESETKNNNNNNMKNINKTNNNPETSSKNYKAYFTKEKKGLDDNYLNDYENKRKAKLALLMIMNKYSGGNYCKEINNYFENTKKAAEQKQLETMRLESSKNANSEINKNFFRQKCLESFDIKDLTKSPFSNKNRKKLFSRKFTKKNSDAELALRPERSSGNLRFPKDAN